MNPLQVIEDESAAFLAAARQGLDVPVPSCPKWRLRELVGHLGRTHRYHASHVVRRTTEPPTTPSPEPPVLDLELVGWCAEGVGVLLDALRSTDPEAPAWTWAPHVPPVASFWSRRMALETAVHRWDAQNAHGGADPVAPQVAADGVDEVLFVHRPADWDDAPVTVSGVVAVLLTDTGTQHVVQVSPDGLSPSSGAADAALTGNASDVLLALWGRLPLEPLVEGDVVLVQALRTG